MSRYVLPSLGYDYAALEPHLSGKMLELHHDKHHRAYVTAANEAIEELIEARRKESFDHIAALERAIAFNVSGHVLHSLFWRNLSPDGGGEPRGDLREAIARDFGSFERMKKQLIHTASTIMGSGWAALVWDPVIRRLGTTQIHDHQSDVTQGSVPLFVIDAWEHAYYLQYQNEKARFFEGVFKVTNWGDVAHRYQRAAMVDLGLPQTADGDAAPELHH